MDVSAISLNEAQQTVLLDTGFVVIEQACDACLWHALQQECQQLEQQTSEFREARLIEGQLNHAIRGDHTRWLQPGDLAGSHYLTVLENLAHALNYHWYAGLRRVEAHYAIYAPGDAYSLHRDNARLSHALPGAHRQGRVFSTVLYLNSHWQPHWHGELHVQDLHHQWHMILPMPNRLVIFHSNLLHEVRPALQKRYSIAGWLRRDADVMSM